MHPDNPFAPQFRHAKEMIGLVARKEFTCCAIAGGAGLGKTYTVEQTLKGLGVPYRIFHGSGPGLMLAAYLFAAGGVIVLDDSDNLVVGGGVPQANLMKQLLFPARVRTISNHTLKAAEGNGATPAEFDTEATVIWLTNMDINNPKTITKKMQPHIDALKDRGLQPVILSDDPWWKLDYVVHLVVEEGLLHHRREPLSLVEANDVLSYFVTNAWRLPTISVRAVEEMAVFRKKLPGSWRDILDGRLRATPICGRPLPPIPVIFPASRIAA
jgi:hypothetical protein